MNRPTTRRMAAAAVAGVALLATTVATALPASAQAARRSAVPSSSAHADRGAAFLARQLDGRGYIRLHGKADPSDTAQSVLALAAAGTQTAAAGRGLRWLAANARTIVHTGNRVSGTFDPGAIAFLILDAHALGADPRDFGGVDLVADLLASQHVAGRDRGLFGRSPATYDGAYRQGLALVALAAVGDTTSVGARAGVAWLVGQQCADGGWEAYRTSTRLGCGRPDAATYSGPDTNSTALAAEGLAAQKASWTHRIVPFLVSVQSRDGGWGYYGGPSDADSTSVVAQALIALHAASIHALTRSGGTPLRVLERDQLASGAEAYQPSTSGRLANLLATEQAVPALAGLAFPVEPGTVAVAG